MLLILFILKTKKKKIMHLNLRNSYYYFFDGVIIYDIRIYGNFYYYIVK